MIKRLLPLALLALAAPALADAPAPAVQQQVADELAKAPKGTRFGLLVVDDAGAVIAAIDPDQRFIPASNTKLFTTAAAWALLPGVDKPDAAGGAQVSLLPNAKNGKVQDVLLYGRGDARMSAAPDCKVDCLSALADAVAARTKVVGDVIGSDNAFPDQRWSPGMSWNNFGSNDAAAASALSLDSNEMVVKALPGLERQPPRLEFPGYVTVVNDALTGEAGGKTTLVLEHPANSREFRLYGRMPADAREWRERIAVDDPACFTAWTFARMLRDRGVAVRGKIVPSHRPVDLFDDPEWRSQASEAIATARLDRPIAALVPPPLAQDIAVINKDSQNLHAELLLRRIGRLGDGSGSLADGLAAERALFDRAGIPREGYDFFDGSGMSSYNRISPRAAVALLRWVDRQPWGAAWYATLPIAGRDGTLKRRFIGTLLEANLTAKTGTLNASNALSGTFRAASGHRLTFAFFANDVPDGASALAAMEAVLAAIAAGN